MFEKNIFNVWLENEKKNGLIDITLYLINTNLSETEELFSELNSMNRAIDEKRFTQIFDL